MVCNPTKYDSDLKARCGGSWLTSWPAETERLEFTTTCCTCLGRPDAPYTVPAAAGRHEPGASHGRYLTHDSAHQRERRSYRQVRPEPPYRRADAARLTVVAHSLRHPPPLTDHPQWLAYHRTLSYVS